MTQRIQKVHFTGDKIKLLENTPKDPKTRLPEPRLEPPLLSSSSWSFCHSVATSCHLEIITSTNANEMLPSSVSLSRFLSLTLYKVIYGT